MPHTIFCVTQINMESEGGNGLNLSEIFTHNLRLKHIQKLLIGLNLSKMLPQTCQQAVEWNWAERHRSKAPVAWSERRPADLAIQNIMQARSQMSIYSQKFSNPVHDPAWVRRPKAGLDLEMMMMQKSGASECSPQCATGWPRWLHSLRNSTTHYTHCTLYHTIHYTIKTIH